jgi:hypothetical protein
MSGQPNASAALPPTETNPVPIELEPEWTPIAGLDVSELTDLFTPPRIEPCIFRKIEG